MSPTPSTSASYESVPDASTSIVALNDAGPVTPSCSCADAASGNSETVVVTRATPPGSLTVMRAFISSRPGNPAIDPENWNVAVGMGSVPLSLHPKATTPARMIAEIASSAALRGGRTGFRMVVSGCW